MVVLVAAISSGCDTRPHRPSAVMGSCIRHEDGQFIAVALQGATLEDRHYAFETMLESLDLLHPGSNALRAGLVTVRSVQGGVLWEVDFHVWPGVYLAPIAEDAGVTFWNWHAHAERNNNPVSAGIARDRALRILRGSLHTITAPGAPLHGRVQVR